MRRFPIVLVVAAIAYGLAVIGLGIMIAPGAVIACTFFVAVPAAVAERIGPLRAMNRSAELTGGVRWSLFALLVMITIALFVAAQLVIDSGATLLLLPVLAITVWLTTTFNAVAYAELCQARERRTLDETVARVFE